MRHASILVTLFFAVASPAAAADSEGSFAIKGAGAASCGDFNAAWAKSSPDLGQYGGWMEGYLTAQNLHLSDTYDIAPWQSARTLLGYLRSACEQLPPETQVIRAVDAVLRTLLPARLEKTSRISGVQADGRGVVIYITVLEQVQARLVELGFLETQATGDLDALTVDALRAYQESEGLEVSGLPNQATLISLLANPS